MTNIIPIDGGKPKLAELNIDQAGCAECGFPQHIFFISEMTEAGQLIFAQCCGCGHFDGIGYYYDSSSREGDSEET